SKDERGATRERAPARLVARGGRAATAPRSALSLTCPACGEPISEEVALEGRDRLYGGPGEFLVVICGSCGSGRTLPFVASESLGALYPAGYHGLPENLALRALA